MIDCTFWKKYIIAANSVGRHDWQLLLAENMIESTFCEKNLIDSTFWEKHDWQHILGKKHD
jgi:hypothetical protein